MSSPDDENEMRNTTSVPLALALVGLVSHAEKLSGDEGDYELRSIRAASYYHETGRVGERDLFDPSLVLRNTIIGGGDVESPTSTVLVLVTLGGPNFQKPRGTLTVVAQAHGRDLLDESVKLETFFSKNSVIVVPFLIYDVGCAPLDLNVKLATSGGKVSAMKGTVPFVCGE
jgi:hypothetical protein